MHLYFGQVKQLFRLTPNEIKDLLIEGLKSNAFAKEEFSEQEVDTWGISVQKLVQRLNEGDLGEISIVLEYFIPGNLLRLDAVLIGYNSPSQLHVMIVELKEWGQIIGSPDPHHVDIGVSRQPIRQHPAAQLNHYVTSLRCYHSELQKKNSIQLSTMSYLPNLTEKNRLFEPPHTIYEANYLRCCFGKDEEKKLCSFLKESFVNKPVAKQDNELFTNGIYSMSEASLAGISKALQGERFVALLDEQRDVKIKAMELIKLAFQNNHKLVLVIQGNAGTGKTILGLELIRQYIKRYPLTYFGTIPQTLRTVIDGLNKDHAMEHGLDEPAKLPTVNAILKLRNTGHIVVIDESHRLTDVQDVMSNLCSRFQIIVLLQDDNQRIKITEQGTVDNIRRALGYTPEILSLQTQQRAKNSGTFTQNVDEFLTGGLSKSVDLKKYDLQVFDSLHDIDTVLKDKMTQGYSAKWLAPFCWDWKKKIDDIRICDGQTQFVKAWNPTLATQYEWYKQTAVNHLDQVGCIYTAQGLEFDYVGLIFWDDLYYDSTSKLWKVTLKDNYDNSFINEIARAYGGTFNKYNRTVIYNGQQYQIDNFIENVNATNVVSELVMNIYRVLLSRGKKGLYIWFKDVKTKLYFMQQFSQRN
ncbi:DUF2075 domain-containing protein [Bacillus thuringiensis]|uniref:DNA/RNA helicase domain-containing protein n=1 Tax=Bacillus thuringiensis TaxID=1428 RepID=UPI0018737AE3|nr:DNA/RNA helicase domain-containing protein [Bacillus thuringiensis]MBE5091492.1 DUF2075 domain-containing protein [Bacillus thuringiensis]